MSNQCVEMNSIEDRLTCRSRTFQHFLATRCFANFLEYFHVVMTQVLKSFVYRVVPPTHVQLTKIHVTNIIYVRWTYFKYDMYFHFGSENELMTLQNRHRLTTYLWMKCILDERKYKLGRLGGELMKSTTSSIIVV